MERRHAEPWLQIKAVAPELLASTRRPGSGVAGGDAAELSQGLRSQHSPGCDSSGHPHHSGAAANDLCMLGDSSQKEPSLHTPGASTEYRHLLPSVLMGEQVAAQAQTLVLGSSSLSDLLDKGNS